MARPPTSGKVPSKALTYIWPRHRQIMYRLVAGEKQVEISAALNISQTRLSVIVNSPMFKKEFKKLEDAVFENAVATRGNITDRVNKLQPTALSVIEDLMKSKRTGKALKRQCANDILELGQKMRRTGEDDGLNPVARMISEAFKLAETAHNGSSQGIDKPPIDIDSMEINSETGLPVDPPEDLSEVEAEGENEKEASGVGVSESVQDVLGEMGILDPA